MSTRDANRRVRLLLGVFLLAFLVILGRAVWLQVFQAGRLDRLAVGQQVQVRKLPARRGTIFDRVGNPLAIAEQATTVYADPRLVRDPARVARAAGRLLGVDAEQLYGALGDRSRRFVFVARQADPAQAGAFEKLGLDGVGSYAEDLRRYPQGRVAAQVLGFAGVDNAGLDGLERSLDGQLAGRPGSETVVTDPFGRVIDELDGRPERAGEDARLTIDAVLQAQAEKVLAETLARWRAKGATAIVLDTQGGEVLAMANAPGYDANRFGSTPPPRRRNRAVTDMYEPGSTFKLVTMSAALAEGVATPRTSFLLPPSIRVADRVIGEDAPRPTERMTVARILAQSSNVGTVTIARQLLGERRLARWIARFGFGEPTGIDLPGESAGAVLPLEQWSGSTIGTVPIGQGIAVTPIQMASVYAAIGNGGLLRRPHVVERVGATRRHDGRGRRIVSPTVAAQVMTMLRGVVQEGGTGTLAALPGYTVAGKTGTASKPENGHYSDSRYVASFVGLVPATKPRLAIMVMVDEPRGNIFGGTVAAPAFQALARFALQYLEVPPDAPLPQ